MMSTWIPIEERNPTVEECVVRNYHFRALFRSVPIPDIIAYWPDTKTWTVPTIRGYEPACLPLTHWLLDEIPKL